MKSLIFGVLTVALYGTVTSAAPTVQSNGGSLGKTSKVY